MKLAFVVYKYFPYGGMQRNFLRIARACKARGHEVQIFTMGWDGELPEGMNVHKEKIRALSNPAKYRKFNNWLVKQLAAQTFDLVVGFNKMPGLDVYYCGDPCYEYKSRHLRPWWYRYTPRYRHFSRYEQAIFSPGLHTRILMFSERQRDIFRQIYQTEPERMVMLPPGINRDRCVTDDYSAIRAAFRAEFNVSDDQLLLLSIGSGFRTKGLDRTIRALADLPEDLRKRCKLFVIGQDDPREFKLLAASSGVSGNITFFSGRDDVPRFLQGADMLVHPAYAENTGGVLLEAVVAGLPVLVTDVCGYARYIKEADAGLIVGSPFSQQDFNDKLLTMMQADRSAWRNNGIEFSKNADIYSMPERAAEAIEAARVN